MANNQNAGNTGTNQTEGEFFAVVETGRRGVQQALETMNDELMAIAADSVRKQGDTWKARALAWVAGEDRLRPVLQHKRGVWSVYQGLAKMAQMGLQPGGHFPHAYLVPFAPRKGDPKIAQPIITAEGYKFSVLHGPQPVVRDITYAVVRDGDKITIDQAAGEVHHIMDPLSERGKVLGVWVRVVPINGTPVVQWYGYADLIAVRDNRSLSWRYDKNSSPWKTDEEAMLMKTAVKKALKPYAAEAEGLAMLYAEDDTGGRQAPDDHTDYPTPPRNVTERAGNVLDNVMDVMGEPEDDEPTSEPDDDDESDTDTVDDSGTTGTDDADDKTGDLF